MDCQKEKTTTTTEKDSKEKINTTEDNNCKEKIDATKANNYKEKINATEDNDCKEKIDATENNDCKEKIDATENNDCKEKIDATEDNNCKEKIEDNVSKKEEPAKSEDAIYLEVENYLRSPIGVIISWRKLSLGRDPKNDGWHSPLQRKRWLTLSCDRSQDETKDHGGLS